jgi:predicted transcriptional regulator
VLWRQSASTVREVHEPLGKDSGYTTLKLMQRMFEKGLVTRNERYRSHVYEARAPKEETQRPIAGDLLKRAFLGSAKSLLPAVDRASGLDASAFSMAGDPAGSPLFGRRRVFRRGAGLQPGD